MDITIGKIRIIVRRDEPLVANYGYDRALDDVKRTVSNLLDGESSGGCMGEKCVLRRAIDSLTEGNLVGNSLSKPEIKDG